MISRAAQVECRKRPRQRKLSQSRGSSQSILQGARGAAASMRRCVTPRAPDREFPLILQNKEDAALHGYTISTSTPQNGWAVDAKDTEICFIFTCLIHICLPKGCNLATVLSPILLARSDPGRMYEFRLSGKSFDAGANVDFRGGFRSS
eukprot:3035121-Rhodomonas_salina.2